MDTPPRILMIISYFYPARGGAEQQAIQLASRLIRQGIPVTVLTRKMCGLPQVECINGISVHRKIITTNKGKLFGLLYLVSVAWFLLRHRTSYDIIHCHLAQGFHSVAALIIKFLFHKRVIIKIGATGELSDFAILRKTFMGWMSVRMLRYADKIVVVCNQARKEALHYGIPPKRIELIPNGVDCTLFTPAPEQRHPGCITFIGRLDKMKGVDVLLEAFSLLRQQGVRAILRIIGDGPEMSRLIAHAQALRISNDVFFYGLQDDIPGLLRETAIFVLPSFSEGLSNVVLEAMACGLPVVATRVGGIPDIIVDHDNGLLVEPNNPDQLKSAIQCLIEDRALADRLGKAAQQTVLESCSFERVTKAYLTLYHTIIVPKKLSFS
ncbi:MAG: glycosyltransferase family 4 protein [Desulfobacterota bacterium]|nr:glycosyltransferase family 4 protein [Thermodesulfobacteriota bacterium]